MRAMSSSADSTIASSVLISPAKTFFRRSIRSDPLFTPMRIGTLRSRQRATISGSMSFRARFPGFSRMP
jgi:hypothetical protein